MINIIDLTNRQFSLDRASFRKELINLFLDEIPGTGKGDDTSKYRYIVKRIGKQEVYLSRPAQFNNGFDLKGMLIPSLYKPNIEILLYICNVSLYKKIPLNFPL